MRVRPSASLDPIRTGGLPCKSTRNTAAARSIGTNPRGSSGRCSRRATRGRRRDSFVHTVTHGPLGVKNLLERRSAIAFAKASSGLFTPSMTQAARLKWLRSGTAMRSIAAPSREETSHGFRTEREAGACDRLNGRHRIRNRTRVSKRGRACDLEWPDGGASRRCGGPDKT